MWQGQNQEDKIISEYFGDYIGILLDIGANDGLTLSNSYILITKGWRATLIEPSPIVFPKLEERYYFNTDAQCLQFAIGTENAILPFYHSGELLGNGDISLVSTLDERELERWKSAKIKFDKIEVPVINFETLLMNCKSKYFDFISMDIEGMELSVLPQINLYQLGVKCFCVEWNGKNFDFFDSYFKQYGLKLLAQNAENLIYVK